MATVRAAVAALAAVSVALAASLGAGRAASATAPPADGVDAPLPEHLADTGLYAPGSSTDPRDGVLGFTPQYPLWSDGATKRRWLALPPGGFIDGTSPDAWAFPPGTRLWKEFALGGRRIETRYIERTPRGAWRFASYVWNEAGDDAVLAPARGIRALAVAAAPGGRYAVPGRTDCLACHGGSPVPVLGASALQLSPARDPLATGASPPRPDAVDLRGLAERGLLRGLPPELLAEPPRIPARSPLERAALGTLHGNCAHCHHRAGTQVPLALTLAQRVADPAAALHEVLQSTLGAASRFRPPGSAAEAHIVVPGQPEDSVLTLRMASRQPQRQMPPLGTELPDTEGLALVQRWIASALPPPDPRQEIHP
ncbi:hypothetical protein [Ideonella sp.]|uniref:hypothetical protein n=1 Tax=Ideonella sp. TaxID=1929293 RepID=UPI002B459AF2|nr:hypothetical protein [Ideonella sp.]HJV69949.1 hypothetical protein [Ideonella sp.]